MIPEKYPDANILDQRGYWDEATRKVVLDRVHNVPQFKFFSRHECQTLLALCDRVIPQSHRPSDHQVPIAPWIDQRCQNAVVDGFRFDNMPSNEVAWRWGLEGLDQTAQALFDVAFIDLGDDRQDQTIRAIQGNSPPGEVWQRMPPARWWNYVAVRQISGAYYAHPYAWDEIGFGGPAYPRGYASLNLGAPEPWEAREVDEADRHGHTRGRRP